MAQTFKNAKAVLADTATTVYTCPAGTTAIVIGAQVSNVDNVNSCDLQFWWTDSSDTDAATYLGYDVVVPPKAAYEPISGKLVLEAGDTIKGLGSAASDLEATISILELS
jgi:hypothetical protein